MARLRESGRLSPGAPATLHLAWTHSRMHFLEVNVAPGLTETFSLPMVIESDGAELGAVFAELLERAVARS